MEEYVKKIERCLKRKRLGYPFDVDSYQEGKVSVFVDTYEVNDDPVGCMSDISEAVQSKFPELTCSDTECHEMVIVTFTLLEKG